MIEIILLLCWWIPARRKFCYKRAKLLDFGVRVENSLSHHVVRVFRLHRLISSARATSYKFDWLWGLSFHLRVCSVCSFPFQREFQLVPPVAGLQRASFVFSSNSLALHLCFCWLRFQLVNYCSCYEHWNCIRNFSLYHINKLITINSKYFHVKWCFSRAFTITANKTKKFS